MSASTAPVPSDPPPQPLRLTRVRSGLAMLFLGALACVLAAAPAHQPEVWSHLARGKMLLEGRPAPDRDPHLISPPNGATAHAAGLYDVLVYGAFAVAGGAGVAISHALLAASFAVVMFVLVRTSDRVTPGLIATVLGLVAVSPWLGPTPRVASLLLFAAFLLVIKRARRDNSAGTSAARVRWFVFALIVVWANVDRRVVLGPITLGLLAIVAWRRDDGPAARWAFGTFALAVFASLLSPNHMHVWNLAGTVGALRESRDALSLWPNWSRPDSVIIAAAYALLILLGVLAFVRDRVRHLLPMWLLMLALSGFTPGAAPVFAVSASAAAGGAFDGLHRLAPGSGSRRYRLVKGLGRFVLRLALPVAATALIAAVWTGTMLSPSVGRPDWAVKSDDSLRDAVLQVAAWRSEGALGADAHGLTFSPVVADYWAWFGPAARAAPGERVDARDLDQLRKDLGSDSGAGGWRASLRSLGIDHVILQVDGIVPTESIVTRLGRTPVEWPLLYLRGRTAVFGWHDPARTEPGSRPTPAPLDLDRRAFAPGPDDLAPADAAPKTRPGTPRWLAAFVAPRPESPADRDEAALYLAYFDGHRERYATRYRTAWLAGQHAWLTSTLTGAGTGAGPAAATIGQFGIGVPGDWAAFVTQQDDGPLAALVLAVRAARRAILANPNDPKTHFLLGEAYFRMAQSTRERMWRYQLPVFDRIRHLQAVNAYQHALALRPGSVAANGRLARIYRDVGCLDLALRHLNAMIAALGDRRPGADPQSEVPNESLALLVKERDGLAAEVKRRGEVLDGGIGSRRILDVAREAVAMGLHDRALTLLLGSDASEFGPDGVRLELELLLQAGRVRDARAWFEPELERTLGPLTYSELLGTIAAVSGDYAHADAAMRAVAGALLPARGRLPVPQAQAAYDIARALGAAPFVGGNPGTVTYSYLVREGLQQEIRQITMSLRQEANAHVVTGLLALEAGQVRTAEAQFRLALARIRTASGELDPAGIDFSGRRVAEDCLRLIESGRAGR